MTEPATSPSGYVRMPNGTVFPVNVGEVEWVLRYKRDHEREYDLRAASVLNIFQRLAAPTTTEADAVRLLRKVREATKHSGDSDGAGS